MRFDELLTSDDLLDALWDMHFDDCTPIQEKAIPVVLDGNDLMACAQTGTGKTAAYLLPVVDLLNSYDYPSDAINCVIMAPTRELAQQIDQQLQGLSYFLPISSIPIYGGTDGYTYEQQRKSLKLGADIVIATPGRLLSHLNMGYVDLSRVSFFILDEADRMLDMGFFDDIMKIVGNLPKERQTLMFSATMPPKIKLLAEQILNNPKYISLAISRPADKIQQSAYVVNEEQKLPLITELFKDKKPEKVIVFSGSKLKVKQLYRALGKLNFGVGEMHSDLDQRQREDVILDFKSGKIKVLIATDIMARGIDIDDIRTVINYDVPHEAEDYVHRVGRTARADRDGEAITFISREDIRRFKGIERFLKYEVTKNQVPEHLGETPDYNASSGNRNGKSGNRRNGSNRKRGGAAAGESNQKRRNDNRNRHRNSAAEKKTHTENNSPSGKKNNYDKISHAAKKTHTENNSHGENKTNRKNNPSGEYKTNRKNNSSGEKRE